MGKINGFDEIMIEENCHPWNILCGSWHGILWLIAIPVYIPLSVTQCHKYLSRGF